MKRNILIGIGGALLALMVAGVVLAGPSLERQIGATSQAAPTAAAATAQPNRAGPQRGKAAKVVRLLIEATADVTNLRSKDVTQALIGGKNLAQIAQEHGKTGDDVVKAARTKLQDRLQQAVGRGRLTQDRANAMLAQFDQAAPTVVSDASLGQQIGRAIARQHPVGSALVKATADVTGLQPKDVLQELRAGKSLAQIAQEHGKTGDDILAKLREQGNQRLQKALDRAKDLINQPGLSRKGTP